MPLAGRRMPPELILRTGTDRNLPVYNVTIHLPHCRLPKPLWVPPGPSGSTPDQQASPSRGPVYNNPSKFSLSSLIYIRPNATNWYITHRSKWSCTTLKYLRWSRTTFRLTAANIKLTNGDVAYNSVYLSGILDYSYLKQLHVRSLSTDRGGHDHLTSRLAWRLRFSQKRGGCHIWFIIHKARQDISVLHRPIANNWFRQTILLHRDRTLQSNSTLPFAPPNRNSRTLTTGTLQNSNIIHRRAASLPLSMSLRSRTMKLAFGSKRILMLIQAKWFRQWTLWRNRALSNEAARIWNEYPSALKSLLYSYFRPKRSHDQYLSLSK